MLAFKMEFYFAPRDGHSLQEKLKTSYLKGPSNIPLLKLTLGQLLQQAADNFGDRTAAVFIHQDIRKTYNQLLKDVRRCKTTLMLQTLKFICIKILRRTKLLLD